MKKVIKKEKKPKIKDLESILENMEENDFSLQYLTGYGAANTYQKILELKLLSDKEKITILEIFKDYIKQVDEISDLNSWAFYNLRENTK